MEKNFYTFSEYESLSSQQRRELIDKYEVKVVKDGVRLLERTAKGTVIYSAKSEKNGI